MEKEPRMTTITRQALVERIVQKTGYRRAEVKRTISAFLDVMGEELAAGNRIEFREFGVFEPRDRAARMAQNPKTLERVTVPPRRIVKFRPGRQMRDRLDAAATTAQAATHPQRARGARKSPPKVQVTAAVAAAL
jgi:integration host factor subunit beta